VNTALLQPSGARLIEVVIVDDSVVVRRFLQTILSGDKDFRLLAALPNGRELLDYVKAGKPADVIVLDVEMPELDGRETVQAVRASGCKTPIIMFSTLTQRGQATTLECIGQGANDYVAKPSNNGGGGAFAWSAVGPELLKKLRTYGRAQRARGPAPTTKSVLPPGPRSVAPPGARSAPPAGKARDLTPRPRGLPPPPVAPAGRVAPVRNTAAESSALNKVKDSTGRPLMRPDIVVVASSMGGPDALPVMLTALRESGVPILVVQHMPANLTDPLKSRLDREVKLPIKIALNGAIARPNEVTLCPGWKHLSVRRDGAAVVCVVDDGPPVGGAKPCADTLFKSAAQTFGGGVLAIVMTGMGSDGLAGARAIVEHGGEVIVQDQRSSAAWGMPGAVAGAGLASLVLPLQVLGEELRQRLAAIPGRDGATVRR
jgi:two-component system, chemotaxis family, protein-glutamate methylesterase/glutaminase